MDERARIQARQRGAGTKRLLELFSISEQTTYGQRHNIAENEPDEIGHDTDSEVLLVQKHTVDNPDYSEPQGNERQEPAELSLIDPLTLEGNELAHEIREPADAPSPSFQIADTTNDSLPKLQQTHSVRIDKNNIRDMTSLSIEGYSTLLAKNSRYSDLLAAPVSVKSEDDALNNERNSNTVSRMERIRGTDFWNSKMSNLSIEGSTGTGVVSDIRQFPEKYNTENKAGDMNLSQLASMNIMEDDNQEFNDVEASPEPPLTHPLSTSANNRPPSFVVANSTLPGFADEMTDDIEIDENLSEIPQALQEYEDISPVEPVNINQYLGEEDDFENSSSEDESENQESSFPRRPKGPRTKKLRFPDNGSGPSRINESNDGEYLEFKIFKLAPEYGGTSKINAVDVVSEIVLELLSAPIKPSAYNISNHLQTYKDLLTSQFTSLVDVVDANKGMALEVRRSEKKRDQLRLQLAHFQKQRVALLTELEKTIAEEKEAKESARRDHEINKFANDILSSDIATEQEQASHSAMNVMNRLQQSVHRLEPLSDKDYGVLERLKRIKKVDAV